MAQANWKAYRWSSSADAGNSGGDVNQTGFESSPDGGLPAINFGTAFAAPGLIASASFLPSFAVLATTSGSAGSSSSSSSTGTTAASSVSSVVGSVPSWVSGLATASIAADMAAADVSGVVTYAGLTKIFTDLAATLSSTSSTLTTAEFNDLKTIVSNLNNGMSTSAYLTGIVSSLVNGSLLNATWTGGNSTSTSLGNLAAGASVTQLNELIGKWFLGTDLPKSTVSMDGSTFSVSYSACSLPLYNGSTPSMNDINQGYLGDCYFLASLAEVADQNPNAIQSMITSNGNNTYGVRFYINGSAQYVTVNNVLAGGGNEFNSGTALWASIAEKAYAQLEAAGVFTGNTSVNYGNSWSTIGNGGSPEYALEEITGSSSITDYYSYGGTNYAYVYNQNLGYKSYQSGLTTASILNTLVADLAAGDDVVLTSVTNATDSQGRTTLVSSHALSIYGYDSSTGMLQIRNPWGSEYGQSWDTTFEVSLSTLLSVGDTISVDAIGTGGSSSSPTVTNRTATQTWKQGQSVSFTLASNTFTDPQGQTLTYSARLASGAALPSWLTFNASTRTFTGTVPSSASDLSIIVTATDTSGLSASETFSVSVPATAPTLSNQTATQTWKIGQAISFTLASNTFSDPQGQTFTYSARLSNGSALPSWLAFNSATGTFSGTVPKTANGLSITVTATDTSGLSASETFNVLTQGSAPIVSHQTAAQTWKLGQSVNLALASNTFSDPQGQTLTYTATLANGQPLPSWLTFNAANLTFTGTVPNTANGLSIRVTATDTGGLSVSETIAVSTPATAPTLTSQTAAQTWKMGQSVNFTLASNTFSDPQGEALTYRATLSTGAALPSWLSFDASTGTFTGVVANTANGLSIRVTATDTSGLSVSETFNVSTPATAPTLTDQTATQTWKMGQAVNFTLASDTFNDPQGQKLTYKATLASGAALPSWLTFNTSTGTFTGTVPNTASGLAIRVTASDTSGLSVSETFSVLTPATAPTLVSQTATQTWKMGQSVSFTLPSSTFNDPQGQKLTYKATLADGSALPSWLVFNSSTGAFTGTVPNTASGLAIRVTATDVSGLSVSETFSVLTPATAPTLVSQTATQSWKMGQSVNFTLPSTTFKDPQGQRLTYSATLADGTALPSWLTLNSSTGTFTGTVPNTASGLAIRVTATDVSGLSVSEIFSVLTPATAPTLVSQTAAQVWKMGQSVNFTLPSTTFRDPQGQTLTYRATLANGSALPSWLSFNTSTGTFTGTVPNTASGLSIRVTASDASGLSISETFSVSTPASAPSLSLPPTTLTWNMGQAVNFTLPAGTFVDPQGQTLTYKATLSTGAALPSWLTFNSSTGTFTGTVPNTANGLTIRVTATDTSGLSASETFSVLTPASAPVLTSQTATQTVATGKAFTLALPSTTFTDPQGEKLTYTARQQNGSALPSWLSFNGTTDSFSGTAPASAQALSLTVTARDSSGLSVAETFTLSVAAAAASLTQAIASLGSSGISSGSTMSKTSESGTPLLATPMH
ncbi:MAG: putative Ig domain-containing protein [Ancalomicrobiaceae bacterium]|nr:putative Ig domain-containing protein [Ancalomicrobiaceae bacterium]